MRILSLCLLFVSFSVLAEPPEGYPFVGYDEGMRLAQQSHKKAFIYFGRYGCGFCGKTNTESFSNTELNKLYVKNYALIYLDAESGDRMTLPTGERISSMEFGARQNVFGTPTFLYLEPTGEILLRAPGFKTVKDFQDMDRYIQSGKYHNQSINEFLQAEHKP